MKTFRTGKKVLSVFLSMLIIMTSCITVSPVFAADETGHNYVESTTYEPTCTQDGFTLMICTDAGCTANYQTNIVPAKGHSWEDYEKEATCTETGGTGSKCSVCGTVDFKTVTDPIGHNMSDWYFEPQAGGTYYYHKRNCGRNGCGYVEYEYAEGSETEKQTYYKVDFLNKWIAKEFDTAEDGTKLAKDEWSPEYYDIETTTVYVKEGETAVYNGKVPTRSKTKEFGAYQFIGWSFDNGDGTVYEQYNNVTSNLILEAQFKGETVVYTVAFSGYDGTTPLPGESFQYTYQHVAHGEKIQFNPARYCVPQHPDKQSLYFNYSFNGWDLTYDPTNEKLSVEDTAKNYKYGDNVTTVEIYSDHTIIPQYESIPKKYKVIYHDYDGKIIYNGEENGVIFEYSTRPSFVPEVELPSDDAYYYSFGVKDFKECKWKDVNGNPVDVSSLTVPSGTSEYDPEAEKNEFIDDADKGIIHLYPNIIRMAKYYTIELYVMDIDGETPAEGATVQVTDIVADNQASHLIGTPYILDEHGYAALRVPYAEGAGLEIGVYQVEVTLDGRTVTGIITETHLDGAISGDKNKATLNLKLMEPTGEDKDKGCTCICHSFLGNIYITFLNIIYNIFGTKIVCCYDMYVRHSDKLVYTK